MPGDLMLVWWWVSVDILGPQNTLLGPVGGLTIFTEGGDYVLGQPSVDMRCCMKTIAWCRGHMPCLVFARGVLFALEAGIGALWGALGRVAGRWGHEPCTARLVVGPGGRVERR